MKICKKAATALVVLVSLTLSTTTIRAESDCHCHDDHVHCDDPHDEEHCSCATGSLVCEDDSDCHCDGTEVHCDDPHDEDHCSCATGSLVCEDSDCHCDGTEVHCDDPHDEDHCSCATGSLVCEENDHDRTYVERFVKTAGAPNVRGNGVVVKGGKMWVTTSDCKLHILNTDGSGNITTFEPPVPSVPAGLVYDSIYHVGSCDEAPAVMDDGSMAVYTTKIVDNVANYQVFGVSHTGEMLWQQCIAEEAVPCTLATTDCHAPCVKNVDPKSPKISSDGSTVVISGNYKVGGAFAGGFAAGYDMDMNGTMVANQTVPGATLSGLSDQVFSVADLNFLLTSTPLGADPDTDNSTLWKISFKDAALEKVKDLGYVSTMTPSAVDKASTPVSAFPYVLLTVDKKMEDNTTHLLWSATDPAATDPTMIGPYMTDQPAVLSQSTEHGYVWLTDAVTAAAVNLNTGVVGWATAEEPPFNNDPTSATATVQAAPVLDSSDHVTYIFQDSRANVYDAATGDKEYVLPSAYNSANSPPGTPGGNIIANFDVDDDGNLYYITKIGTGNDPVTQNSLVSIGDPYPTPAPTKKPTAAPTSAAPGFATMAAGLFTVAGAIVAMLN